MRNLVIPLTAAWVALGLLTASGAEPPAKVARVRPLNSITSDYGQTPRYIVRSYPHHPYHAFGGTTAAGSYAHGVAAVIYARGHYNRLTAEARILHAEAHRQEMQNREIAVETYFALRETNRRTRAAQREPRPTAADLVRFAEMGKPDRLSPAELDAATGAVSWPLLLQAEEFAVHRAVLERNFAQRARQGTMQTTQQARVEQMTRAMLEELRQFVRDVGAREYTVARRFIESLAHEARQPVS
ncbi:MAG: hypothetical protein JXB62_14765 [Pirellulales bacterium]|nr:hypothetical protein [Pirellulales bacterium]